MAFLEINRITKEYGHGAETVRALKDVSFSLDRGVSLAVCGSSGAGKSTLLNIIGGLDRPSSGQVLLEGRDLHSLSDKEEARFRGEHLGFIFQFHHLLHDFSVIENVMMPLLIRGDDRRGAREAALDMLGKVGLAGKEKRAPRELSGGEQQRVAIARSLVHRPKLVLADEPTGNLDDVNGEKVFALLCTLNHDLRATLIVVTHNTVFSKKLNHRLYLNDGQVQTFT